MQATCFINLFFVFLLQLFLNSCIMSLEVCMLKGFFFVMSACLIWGLIFVVPGLMESFSPLEIALCRYFFLGVISSICLSFSGIKKWYSFSWNIWKAAIFYALLNNIMYYSFLVLGLRYANPSVIALLLGISPITTAFYGNWCERECSYKQLILPTFLIGCGLFLVNWPVLSTLSFEGSINYSFGLLCGLVSLIIWNWFVVANARFLKQNSQISSVDWTNLLGIGTLVWVVLIAFFLLLINPSSEWLLRYSVWDSSLRNFVVGGMILGFLCSWLGSYLWNCGSQLLPVTFAGQLIIFETIFGLIFVYGLEGRLPDVSEFSGIAIILFGVVVSMHLFQKIHREMPPIEKIQEV